MFTAKAVQRDIHQTLSGYVKIKLDPDVALALAGTSPRPEATRLAIMKTLAAFDGQITLSQLQVFFGWAHRRSLRES